MPNEYDYLHKPIIWSELAELFPDCCFFCTDIKLDDNHPYNIEFATVTPRAMIPAHALRCTMVDDINGDTGWDCTALFTTQRGGVTELWLR